MSQSEGERRVKDDCHRLCSFLKMTARLRLFFPYSSLSSLSQFAVNRPNKGNSLYCPVLYFNGSVSSNIILDDDGAKHGDNLSDTVLRSSLFLLLGVTFVRPGAKLNI